jgi:prepilin-type N-terminal cleavage/methylation domain-containing protein
LLKNSHLHQHKAFTLVELSIVLLIIGLIIGGITAGSSLIKQAQLRAIISEFVSHTTAINGFKIQFNALPGDFINATTMWPSASTANGNGNGLIESGVNTSAPFEDTYVWQHLALAGLVNGNFSGGVQGPRYVAGSNSFVSKKTPAIYQISSGNGAIYSYASGNFIQLGIYNADACGGYANGGLLNGIDSYNLDSKMDDGVPSSGVFRGARACNQDANNVCASTSIYATTGTTYLLTDTSITCRILYLLF